MDIKQIIKQSKKSIGMIELFKPAEKGFQLSVRGTSIVVGKEGLVLSCAHVFNQIPENERQFLKIRLIRESKGKVDFYERFSLELVRKDDSADFAVFKIKDTAKKFKPLKIGNSSKVEAGEEVGVVGFPLATEIIGMGLGITLMADRFIVGNVKPNKEGEVDFFVFNIYAAPATSGSPVFSLDDGTVIGLLSGRIGKKSKIEEGLEVPQMISLARPINNAKALLNEAK